MEKVEARKHSFYPRSSEKVSNSEEAKGNTAKTYHDMHTKAMMRDCSIDSDDEAFSPTAIDVVRALVATARTCGDYVRLSVT
jgi:hypothetical protein